MAHPGNDVADKWTDSYNECVATFNELRDEASSFKDRLTSQKKEDAEMLTEIASKREEALDDAFEKLVNLVAELCGIDKSDTPIGVEDAPSLKSVIEAFHNLSEVCEDSLDRVGEEFVDTTQAGGENRQVKDAVVQFKSRLQMQINALESARTQTSKYLDTESNSLNDAERWLSDARSKQCGVIYDVFGDRDVDNAVNNNVNNVNNVRSRRDWARETYHDLDDTLGHFKADYDDCAEILSDLEAAYDANNAEYSSLIDGRKRDEHCWISVRALEYHVSATGPETSRDDALRHVAELVTHVEDMVDSDDHVTESKDRIQSSVRTKLGVEHWERLKNGKKYLPGPETDF